MLDPELVGYLDQRFGALADLFARQSERAEQRFGQTDQRFDRMEQRFEQIDLRLDRMDQRFEQIELRLDRMDQRFDRTDQAIREVHILYEDLDSRLRLVAEGVAFVSEALREFRVDFDRQFAEVKAVNRLSYVEIERRLATLGV